MKDEMDLLIGELMGESAWDINLWHTLFLEYGSIIDEKRREQCLRVIKGMFGPEDRRLLFGEIAIPGLYADEEDYLKGIERTERGLYELYKYLRLNVNCFSGWRMLFFEFKVFLTQELEKDMVGYLKRNVPEMELKTELPGIFDE